MYAYLSRWGFTTGWYNGVLICCSSEIVCQFLLSYSVALSHWFRLIYSQSKHCCLQPSSCQVHLLVLLELSMQPFFFLVLLSVILFVFFQPSEACSSSGRLFFFVLTVPPNSVLLANFSITHIFDCQVKLKKKKRPMPRCVLEELC